MTDQAISAHYIDHLLRRLKASSELSSAAADALRRAISIRPALGAHAEVSFDTCAGFLLYGLACRVRILPDGKRQLLDFLIAGDLCDHGFLTGCKSVTRIFTLAPSIVAELRMPSFLTLCDQHPDFLRALLCTTAAESAVTEERIVSLGARSAVQRMSHLFCELHHRLRQVGLVEDDGFDFQVTQAELGDGLGMSAVHVNRTLQRLRRENLVSAHAGRINILDRAGLSQVAGYDPAYLS